MPQLLTLLGHPSFSIWLRAVFLSSKPFYALAEASLPQTKVLGSLCPGTGANDPAACGPCHPAASCISEFPLAGSRIWKAACFFWTLKASFGRRRQNEKAQGTTACKFHEKGPQGWPEWCLVRTKNPPVSGFGQRSLLFRLVPSQDYLCLP